MPKPSPMVFPTLKRSTSSERTSREATDEVFKSAAQIQAATTGLYGADSLYQSIKPHCYEVIGTRQPSIP